MSDHPPPDAWIAACTLALERLVDDADISLSDLQVIASDLAEDPRYSVLTPAAAAALHYREFA